MWGEGGPTALGYKEQGCSRLCHVVFLSQKGEPAFGSESWNSVYTCVFRAPLRGAISHSLPVNRLVKSSLPPGNTLHSFIPSHYCLVQELTGRKLTPLIFM